MILKRGCFFKPWNTRNTCTGTKEAKQFWSKIWEQKEHNKRDNQINNMKKKQDYEKDPVAEIHLGSPRIPQKKIPNWKTPRLDGISRPCTSD